MLSKYQRIKAASRWGYCKALGGLPLLWRPGQVKEKSCSQPSFCVTKGAGREGQGLVSRAGEGSWETAPAMQTNWKNIQPVRCFHQEDDE